MRHQLHPSAPRSELPPPPTPSLPPLGRGQRLGPSRPHLHQGGLRPPPRARPLRAGHGGCDRSPSNGTREAGRTTRSHPEGGFRAKKSGFGRFSARFPPLRPCSSGRKGRGGRHGGGGAPGAGDQLRPRLRGPGARQT